MANLDLTPTQFLESNIDPLISDLEAHRHSLSRWAPEFEALIEHIDTEAQSLRRALHGQLTAHARHAELQRIEHRRLAERVKQLRGERDALAVHLSHLQAVVGQTALSLMSPSGRITKAEAGSALFDAAEAVGSLDEEA